MAKTITISVPDDLFKELKKFPEIKVSARCQAALQKGLEDLKAYKLADEDLLGYAEKRFAEGFEEQWDVFERECEDIGYRWAAKEASLEKLKNVFEFKTGDVLFDEYHEQCQPSEEALAWEYADTGNKFQHAFIDGAEAMWEKIKERLEERGHDV